MIAESYCSLISSLATIFVLLMCVVLRTSAIADQLKTSKVDKEITQPLEVDMPQILFILFFSSALVFAAVFVFGYYKTRDRPMAAVRHKKSGTAELRHLTDKDSYHVFMSHVNATGGDQSRVIKQLLSEVLPGVMIKMPEEEEGGPAAANDRDSRSGRGGGAVVGGAGGGSAAQLKLEKELKASHRVLVFVSRGYFESPAEPQTRCPDPSAPSARCNRSSRRTVIVPQVVCGPLGLCARRGDRAQSQEGEGTVGSGGGSGGREPGASHFVCTRACDFEL